MGGGGWAQAGNAAVGIGSAIAQAAFNARQAAKNRKFQKFMYKRRYRHTVADMRKAGINPILAAGSGLGGGGSPSGSAASMSMPQVAQPMTAAGLASKQKELIDAQTTTAVEQAAKTAIERRLLEAGIPKAELTRDMYLRAGQIGAGLKELGPTAAAVLGMFGVGRYFKAGKAIKATSAVGVSKAIPAVTAGTKRKGIVSTIKHIGSKIHGKGTQGPFKVYLNPKTGQRFTISDRAGRAPKWFHGGIKWKDMSAKQKREFENWINLSKHSKIPKGM